MQRHILTGDERINASDLLHAQSPETGLYCLLVAPTADIIVVPVKIKDTLPTRLNNALSLRLTLW